MILKIRGYKFHLFILIMKERKGKKRKGKERKLKGEFVFVHGVKYLKEQIKKQFKIKPEFQVLRLNGEILEDENNKNVLQNLKSYSKIDLINTKPKEDFENDDKNFKEKYKDEMSQLEEMGYRDKIIFIETLKIGVGNIEFII